MGDTHVLSRKELPRPGLVRLALAGSIGNAEGADALGVSVRKVQRYKVRVLEGGERSLASASLSPTLLPAPTTWMSGRTRTTTGESTRATSSESTAPRSGQTRSCLPFGWSLDRRRWPLSTPSWSSSNEPGFCGQSIPQSWYRYRFR